MTRRLIKEPAQVRQQRASCTEICNHATTPCLDDHTAPHGMLHQQLLLLWLLLTHLVLAYTYSILSPDIVNRLLQQCHDSLSHDTPMIQESQTFLLTPDIISFVSHATSHAGDTEPAQKKKVVYGKKKPQPKPKAATQLEAQPSGAEPEASEPEAAPERQAAAQSSIEAAQSQAEVAKAEAVQAEGEQKAQQAEVGPACTL